MVNARWLDVLAGAVMGLLLAALLGVLALLPSAGALQRAVWQQGPAPRCTPLAQSAVVNKTGTEYRADWQCVQIPSAEQTRVARP